MVYGIGSAKRASWWVLCLVACLSCSSEGDGASTGASANEAYAQKCVETINNYRASLGLAPYTRWAGAEGCSDGEAKSDSETGAAHGAFGTCGESAQNECPGWSGTPEGMIEGCLSMMWAEGPGSDFSKHGHYLNMSSTKYTQVACGAYTSAKGVWAVQNFK